MKKWYDVAEAALWVAAVVQVVFVVALAALSKWWRTFPGRALMLKSTVLAAALGLTLANAHIVYPHQLEVSTVVLCAIAVAVSLQLLALVVELRRDRRGR